MDGYSRFFIGGGSSVLDSVLVVRITHIISTLNFLTKFSIPMKNKAEYFRKPAQLNSSQEWMCTVQTRRETVSCGGKSSDGQ